MVLRKFRPGIYSIAWIGLLFLGATPVHAQGPDSVQQYARAGEAALAQGDYPTAEDAFEHLAKLEPQVAEVHANLGAIYFQQSKYEQAAAELREALKLKPGLGKSATLLALSLAELSRYSEALPGLQKCFRETGDAALQRLCGLQLLGAFTDRQRDAEAVATALKLRQQYPDDPEVLYHASKIFGNFAYLTIRQLGTVAPNSPWKHLAAAEAYESQGATDLALGEYRTVLTLEPGRRGVHYRIGMTFLAASRQRSQADDVANALQEFLAELSLDPANGNAAYEAAEICRKRAEPDEAAKYYERALANYPEFIEAHQGLAAVLIQQQKPDQALPHLQKAIALDNDNEVSWWRLAQAERALGDAAEQKKALAQFQRLHAAGGRKAGGQRAAPELTQQSIEENTGP